MKGVLLINKERGWTSRDVCNKVRRLLNVKATGHSGTLDPFAEGLLVVTINEANKAIRFFDDKKKTYIASLKLGVKTSTGDLLGEVVETLTVPKFVLNEIEKALNSFKGKIKQIPPMTSAVHYKGRKLYQLYYEGEVVEREPREVEIYDISLLHYEEDTITFKVTVSPGTYIRVLGEDIANKLGTIGHLVSLKRTNIGRLSVENAYPIDKVNKDVSLMPISNFLSDLEHIEVDDETKKKVMDGMHLYFANANNDIILIVDKNNDAIAIYTKINDKKLYRCERGLW